MLDAALGVGGHLLELRRTRTGSFGLEQAVGWGDPPDEFREAVLPLSALLAEVPAAAVGAEGRTYLRHGRPLGRAQVLSGFPEGDPPPRLRVLDASGALLALAVPRGFGPPVRGLPLEPVLHPDVVLMD